MIKILHLYYDLMNLYGEYGNIVVLCDNLKKQNIEYELKRYSVGDSFNFDDFDLIYCGSGTENKTEIALKDFNNRLDSFKKAYENKKYILFTGSSIKLLGNDGASIINCSVGYGSKRICGDVICNTDKYKDIVGYINTSYTINNFEDTSIKIDKCDDSLDKNMCIGFIKQNLFAINITGPLLVKNPNILKDVINKLGGNSEFDTIGKYQYMSYSITLDQLKNRFN